MENSGSKIAGVLLAGMLAAGASAPAFAADGAGAAAGAGDGASGGAGDGASGAGDLQPGVRGGADVEKTQVVYAKADACGAVEGVYVVNSFEAESDGAVVDEGAYESVAGLTDSRSVGFSKATGLAAFDMRQGDRFSYQGNLPAGAQMPWSVSVSYELDGVDVDPEALAGACGRLSMTLEVSPNASCEGDWADNYLLQVTGTFGGDTARLRSFEQATAAQVGDDVQLSYMVFPGSSASYVVEADVEDFAFGGWQMAGVPLSIAFDVEDEDLEGAAGQLEELTCAIAQVDEGASSLSEGTLALAEGARSVYSGARSAAAGADALDAAGSQVVGGMSSALSALDSAVAGADALKAASGSLASGIEALAAGSSSYAAGLAEEASGLRAQASQAGSAEEVLSALGRAVDVLEASDDPAERAQAAAQARQLAQALSAVSAAEGAAQALDEAQASYAQVDAALQGLADEGSDASVWALDRGVASLAFGLDQLFEAMLALQEGLGGYACGANELSAGCDALEDGAFELAAGASDLDAGASQLALGTGELAGETSGLDARMIDELRGKIDEMLNPDFVMRDFANGGEVERVQFVVKTAAI